MIMNWYATRIKEETLTMTELEKAASGLLYDANSDPALLEARAQTSDLCMDYNALRSSQKEEKKALLHTILGCLYARYRH